MSCARTVKTSFEMTDGRVLSCEYGYVYTSATWHDPEECDVGEPTYFIDDDEIEYKDLPKGLDKIADKLYEAGSGEFNYEEECNEPCDYEPDYD